MRYVLSIPIGLVLTPLMLHYLGTELFGVWSLIGVLLNLITLTDFGIGTAITKYVAEDSARGAFDELNRVVNTSVLIFGGIGVAVLAVTALAANWLVTSFFKAGPALFSEIRFALLVSVSLFVLNIVFSGYGAVVTGLQRYDLVSTIALLRYLLSAITTVLVLMLGWGLTGLVLNSAVFTSIIIGVNVVVARRLLPSLEINLRLLDRGSVRRLLRFGAPVQVVNLESLLFTQLDKMLLGYFAGPSLVTPYEISASLVDRARLLAVNLTTPILPAASDTQVSGGSEAVRHLYRRALKYSNLVTLPLNVFFIIFAEPIIYTWVGPQHARAVPVLQILSIAYFVAAFSHPIFSLSTGIGWLRQTVYYTALHAILNTSLSLVLIWKWGLSGAGWGLLLSGVISVAYYFVSVNRTIGLPSLSLLMSSVIYPGVLFTAIALVLYKVFAPFAATNFLAILALVGLYLILCFLVVWRSSIIDREERRLIYEKFLPSALQGRLIRKAIVG